MRDRSLGFRRKVLWTVPSRDSLAELADHFRVAIDDGRILKDHVFALARAPIPFRDLLIRLPREDLQEVCRTLGLGAGGKEKARLVDRILASDDDTTDDRDSSMAPAPIAQPVVAAQPVAAKRVFIGHGRSPLWRELKDFLHDSLGLTHDEFNRESAAGKPTSERLAEMLGSCTFAFLVLTAEDEHVDGTKHARENVIHEVGLFQGKLGFHRAILLVEAGCAEFSNIVGLTQIRFPQGNVIAQAEEIRRVLAREGLISR